ncbi:MULTISPECIES: hydroxymethylglutaryl-CoA lyase [unclassified Variovorax]|jgi:hydroxymethylglutaryl-CoA lyase|uniref:hydroxymethylglutaryl-CoA lyase n=1 Tax=unclassified Variovorax TaxID=663243 RepID=UPI000F7ED975|nr:MULTISPECIES: hydroxymethylglutaryl-CoA lyase [unclassified Variovorax]RSZ33242.1 hydroxymethylglutaryl-CoA lyase [Variovorax sp. 553]RSZ33614.1 hydroxymethylglutaryl-CoA lyase [Variovorax sp. 679]
MKTGNGTRLFLNEVATRDGFQMESRFIPTDDKIALIDRLSRLGYAKIEVTSFTSAKAIPALRDGEEVMQRIARRPGVVYTALVPNVRGAERALESRIDEFNIVMSVSETHNLANLRMTREQSFAQLTDVIALAKQAGVPINVSLSCVFGCPMEGEVPPAVVQGWIDRFAALEVQGVTLCDTTGMAFPTQVQALCEAVLARHPAMGWTAHFHNTRGMGLANAVAAVEAGIRRLDMSLGGIGGCPYAPGATGNVATEDVAHMLQCMGYDTGMDLDGLIAAAAELEALVQHGLSGQVSRAGHRLTRHAPPADFNDIVSRARERRQKEPQP